eukprot:CAMPEP_0176500948 /NCGR_PEP_ID=MMETSP0200_2-20121128/13872_1 /TAXON_ID=947934 /ORGANISM="Chaetoceros sp., Strain GSL56" /LENGTH=387 /DNA_ID=CAMNT_0017899747 /DNA_START=892 /DNA_END=2052 /DNA_ORIENTATION=+
MTSIAYYNDMKTEECMSCSESFSSDSDGKESAGTVSYASGAGTGTVTGTGMIIDPAAALVTCFGASSPCYYGDILYCKARGMPLDHIGNNAILCFDKGLERVHGAELKCSHPSCMRDGIKFRYCKHCNKPVAKRNFRKRHAHPELIDLEDESKNSSSYQSHQFHHQQQQPRLVHGEPPLPPLHPAMMSQQQQLHEHQHSSITAPLLKQSATNMMLSMPPLMNSPSPHDFTSDHQQQRTTISNSTRTLNPSFGCEIKHDNILQHHHTPRDHVAIPQIWIDLYQRRPVGGNIIQQQEWLQNVMAVAELGPVVAPNTNRSDLTETAGGERSISNSISAVREEFCRSFPPKFVNCCEDIGLEDGMPKYRQHGESLSLQINTDLDIFGTNGI